MFSFICPAICTSCLKKQKKKSEEHFGLMEPPCYEKDKEKTENQDLRFAKQMAAINLKSTTSLECTPVTSRLLKSEIEKQVEWMPEQWTEDDNEDSQEEEERTEKVESLIASYNEAMATLSEKTNVGKVSPLTFQLKSTWDEATESEKQICIEKAMEGCSIVCEIIAPNAGDKILQSCVQLSDEETEHVSGDLVALMQAYKNAPTKNLKTQILSIYAYRYSMTKLQKLHEPYESITTWKIK
ncbi:uncharacterized protein LOC144659207 [Oculina patagonica]